MCEFLDRPVSNEAGTTSPSEILSNFLGVSVLLVRKGPKPRWCKPTPDFPDLSGAAIKFQDGYPVLLLSHEKYAYVCLSSSHGDYDTDGGIFVCTV